MRTFGLLGLGLVLLAGGPALAGVADQPEKARSHPLDTREPRQEIIDRPDTNGPRDPSAPAVEDGRQGHSTRDRPIEDRVPDAMPGELPEREDDTSGT